MTTIIANKTLINNIDETNFIKGNEYKVINPLMFETFKIKESTIVLNEAGEQHSLGLCAKHFKIKN